ncbi:MAG: gamma-glutamyltranspeptidase/glutathione hydrolase [Bradymonadia bacterium]|jgi:gamma-glutamyltranspeptidase/glutathione hydrolase
MRALPLILSCLTALWLPEIGHAEHVRGVRGAKGMVSADNALAAAVGARILSKGGDAADAAVATALMLGVVQPFASGIGGGGFALVHRTDGAPYALDFREVAPAKANKDMYLDAKGDVIPKASTRGPRAAGVPGEVAGLWALHQAHGKLPWKAVVEPALRAARDGFPVGALLHRRIVSKRAEIAARPRMASRFFDAKGQPVKEGATLTRPQLAKTLAHISKGGVKAFYGGDFVKKLGAIITADGGLISADDLRAYAAKTRPVVRGTFKGYTVLSMPPPSSGGAVLVQVLRVLEPLDLEALGHNSSAYLHRLAEALKHAFADRARVMGDPDFTPVALEALIGDATIQRVQGAFRSDRTLEQDAYGGKYAIPEDGGTSHFSVVDKAGNAVALTSTVNTSFGSMYIAGETGVLLNNQMDDFVAKPGVANAYGLIGRAANAIAPGKRPLSSMSPTVVLKDGKVRMVVGASGGPTIITGTLQALLNVLVFDMDVRAAVSVPRIHHQWVPERLMVEPGIPVDVQVALGRRGHTVKAWRRFTAVQAITQGPVGQAGAADPSKLGAAVPAP